MHILLKKLLSFLTLGVYGVIWARKLAVRIHTYCMVNRIPTRCKPGAVTLWSVLFCPVAQYQLMKGMNEICSGYNRMMAGRSYTMNVQPVIMQPQPLQSVDPYASRIRFGYQAQNTSWAEPQRPYAMPQQTAAANAYMMPGRAVVSSEYYGATI